MGASNSVPLVEDVEPAWLSWFRRCLLCQAAAEEGVEDAADAMGEDDPWGWEPPEPAR